MRPLWSAIACALIVFALLELRQSAATAQDVTVWVVRHADRKDDSGDSDLSKAGFKRAADLAALLQNKGIKTIVTSKKIRTIATAKPLEDSIPAVGVHRVASQADVIATVKQSEPNILVVHHSDTVPNIIGGLGGPKGINILCWQYDRIFVMNTDGSNFSESRYGALSQKKKC
jgi:broad specificity phosphatase PhoE